MIDIKVIGSGSSGNCYLVNINNTKILLEAGLSFKKIQQAMKFRLRDVEACLVTHEHMDHAKAVKDLIKAGVDCYLTKGTAEALGLNSHRINILEKVDEDYKVTKINNLLIKPFEAVHDVAEPVSFYIQDYKTQERLVFITDSAYLKYKIPATDYLMIECNYIKEVIDENAQNKTLNVNLRNRNVKNHMSLETLLEALREMDLEKLKKMYILHLSDNNSDEKRIYDEVKKVYKGEVIIC